MGQAADTFERYDCIVGVAASDADQVSTVQQLQELDGQFQIVAPASCSRNVLAGTRLLFSAFFQFPT